MISADVTLARLLDEHPELVEVLADLNPHFKHLRNQLLRKVMAPRVTVAQAARIAGVPEEQMLEALRRALGEPAAPAPSPALSPQGTVGCPAPSLCEEEGGSGHEGRGAEEGGSAIPAALAVVPDSRQVHIDVREDIARGQEPFARIMGAVKGLREGDVFVLRAPFEPIPLYDVLGKRGFAHWTESLGAADWRLWFYRDAAPGGAATSSAAPGSQAPAPGRLVRIDVRGLEPPQPMVLVLEQLEGLGAGQDLEVIHDRRPLFLYPQLDERGFAHDTDEPEAGVVRILIRRKSTTG